VSSERVASAAIRVRGQLYTGRSHKEAVWVAATRLDLDPRTIWELLGREDFGFTTTSGMFVSRIEAWKIAKAPGPDPPGPLAAGEHPRASLGGSVIRVARPNRELRPSLTSRSETSGPPSPVS
jgi:hypothetical protein